MNNVSKRCCDSSHWNQWFQKWGQFVAKAEKQHKLALLFLVLKLPCIIHDSVDEWIFSYIGCRGCCDLWPLLSSLMTPWDGHGGKSFLLIGSDCGRDIAQCERRGGQVAAHLHLLPHEEDIIRGQASLQLAASEGCCCHAVISSASEDNENSPGGRGGQCSGEGRAETEGKRWRREKSGNWVVGNLKDMCQGNAGQRRCINGS